MKNILLFIILVFSFIANGQTGINNVSPSNSSLLEINSSNKGLLIPNMSITNVNQKGPIVNTPKEGLLIYNNNTNTKKTLFVWNSEANNNNGAWNSHLLFTETPKTAVIGIIGNNISMLDNANAGDYSLLRGTTNFYTIISSGYLPNLSVSKNSNNELLYSLGSGIYLIEASFLITAPAPNPTNRGTMFPNTDYYNMGYFLQLNWTGNNSARVERAVMSKVNQEHRVTFTIGVELPETTPVTQFTAGIGRRSGSTHNDLIHIIPSGSFIKITKIK